MESFNKAELSVDITEPSKAMIELWKNFSTKCNIFTEASQESVLYEKEVDLLKAFAGCLSIIEYKLEFLQVVFHVLC